MREARAELGGHPTDLVKEAELLTDRFGSDRVRLAVAVDIAPGRDEPDAPVPKTGLRVAVREEFPGKIQNREDETATTLAFNFSFGLELTRESRIGVPRKRCPS